MPALVICGTRTFVAGDDLRSFTTFAILLRVLQLCVLVPFTIFSLGHHYGFEERVVRNACDETDGSMITSSSLVDSTFAIYVTFLVSSYVTVLGGLAIEVAIFQTSSRGTPTQPEKRARLHPLCFAKMIPMSALRVLNLVLGVLLGRMLTQLCAGCESETVRSSANSDTTTPRNDDDPCPDLNDFYTYLSVLVGSYFLEAAIVACMGLYFLHKKFPALLSCSRRKCTCCCQCCCTITSVLTCCLYGGTDGGAGEFADISLILADYFDCNGALDIVASDVVVGLKCLARVQRQESLKCRNELKRRVSFVLSMKQCDKPIDIDTIQELAKQIQEHGSIVRALPSLEADNADEEDDICHSNPLVSAEEGIVQHSRRSPCNSESASCSMEEARVVETLPGDEHASRLAFVHGASVVDSNESRHGQDVASLFEKQVVKKASTTRPGVTTRDGSKVTFSGRISLMDVEMGELTVQDLASHDREERVAGQDSLLESDIEIAEELANLGLIEEECKDVDGVERTLDRTESSKNRRQAVIYNLNRSGGHMHYEPVVREVLSRKNMSDKFAIAEGARFMRYSQGIYLFRKYSVQGRSCDACCAISQQGMNCVKSCVECTSAFCRRQNATANHLDFQIGHGYRISDILEARFAALAGLDRAEIKYVQFGEGVVRTPYCISIDHAWKTIVIAIRGTEGFDDVVADLRMIPVSMQECGAKHGFDGSDFYAHAGMLACAEWIYDDLECHGIVDKLLSQPRQHGYNVRLTGHSLGASIAAILSFMLRQKYPSLHCSSFCPAGCTVSRNMAEASCEFVTSYVLDHDVVPRISLNSLENLRKDMLDMIVRLKVTKFQATHANPQVDKDELLHREESIPPSKFKSDLDDFRQEREDSKSERYVRSICLVPPGRIVQLVKTIDDEPSSAGCCCLRCNAYSDERALSWDRDAAVRAATRPYAARWAHVDDFSEIIISSHFLDDHSTEKVLRELERSALVFGLSSPYVPPDDGQKRTQRKQCGDHAETRRRRGRRRVTGGPAKLAASFWSRQQNSN